MNQPGDDWENEDFFVQDPEDEFVVPLESEAPAWVFAREGAPFVYDQYGQGQLFTGGPVEPENPYQRENPLHLDAKGAMKFRAASCISNMIDDFNTRKVRWEEIDKVIMDLIEDAWNHRDVRIPSVPF